MLPEVGSAVALTAHLCVMSTSSAGFPGRVTRTVFADGTRYIVDPARHEVTHHNGWASNMRHALVDVDGNDLFRGPQWQVERRTKKQGV